MTLEGPHLGAATDAARANDVARATDHGDRTGATAPASFPPEGLPGLAPRWSRLVRGVDADGVTRTWHVLDTDTRASDAAEATPQAGPRGTVLCVHGNPTWSYAFRRVLAAAPAGWRVVAPDHLDMGFSERTGTVRALARRIDDLGRLTDVLGVDGPVVLLAHDWGGPIALGWALAHRAQVAGLVLTNTAVHHRAGDAAPTLIRAARARGALQAATVRTPTFLRGATALAGHDVPDEVRRAYAAPYATPDRRRAIAGFVRDIPLEPDHPSAPTLAAIADGLGALAEVPTLLLWGPSDPVFSERYLHDLEARLPHAEVHRVEGASHLTPEDVDLGAVLVRWLPARVGISDAPAPAADQPEEHAAAPAPAADQPEEHAAAPAPPADQPEERTAAADPGPVESSRLWEALA
ncbi:MAG: alpha/beta fold hydrolase, partial [Nitriliruptoraceae bacterium]